MALLPILISALGGSARNKAEGIISELGKEGTDQRMTAAIDEVVADMTQDGVTPDRRDEMRDVVRGAMFRLWRSVIPNGHVADVFRDRQETKVVPVVLLAITATTDLRTIVETTKNEIIRLTF